MKLGRILLVDDDSISNHISTNAINKLGFADQIVVKEDGREALAYLQKECASLNNYPDLILLDLKMPGMDGFEFLEEFEMSCNHISHQIVVVILTSSKNADDIVRLRKIGKYFLVNKPLNVEKLMDIYHRYFRPNEFLHSNSI